MRNSRRTPTRNQPMHASGVRAALTSARTARVLCPFTGACMSTPNATPAPQALPGYLAEPPRLLLVGGKGGVGKTTFATASAIRLADTFPTEQFLLVSTDPAHSVADCLRPAPTDPEPIADVPPNLQIVEFDAGQSHKRFMDEHMARFKELAQRGTFLDGDDIDGFLKLSLPGLDELMAFLQIAVWAYDGRHRTIIVDTAPTGHTLRLLQMPEFFQHWMGAIDAMMAKHRYMAQLFSRRTRTPDELEQFLAGLQETFTSAHELLTDPARCRFVPVFLAEAMSIAETDDLVRKLSELGVPHRETFCNRVIPAASGPLLEAVAARQLSLLAELPPALRPAPGKAEIWHLPLQENEPTGVTRLRRVWSALQPPEALTARLADRVPAASLAPLPEPPSLVHGAIPLPDERARLVLLAGKGGVGKTTIACSLAHRLASGDGAHAPRRVLLVSVDPAHSMADCLAGPVGPTPRKLADNLWGMELDAAAEFEKLRELYRDELQEFLENLMGGADLAMDREAMESLLDLAPPGIDEVMAMVRIVELLDGHTYDTVVLDTAPTGHLLRLLELPELADQWLSTIFKVLLKYKNILKLPTATAKLIQISKGAKRLRSMLTDGNSAHLIPVSIPTEMALSESRDLVQACNKAKVSVPALVLNQVAWVEIGAQPSPLLSALMEREGSAIVEYSQSFPSLPMAVVLRHGPPRGLEALGRLGAALFTAPLPHSAGATGEAA